MQQQQLGGFEQQALRNAQGRAKALMDALELVQARCGFYTMYASISWFWYIRINGLTYCIRKNGRELNWRHALRLAFTLWRLKAWAASTAAATSNGGQQQTMMIPAAGEVAAAGAIGARRMIGACVEMVRWLFCRIQRGKLNRSNPPHKPQLTRNPPPPQNNATLQVEEILTQQPLPAARSRGSLLARSSGESVASAEGGGSASASLVEAGRVRVLQKEMAILKAKLQVRLRLVNETRWWGRRPRRKRSTNPIERQTTPTTITHTTMRSHIAHQAAREVQTAALEILSQYEGRFRDERGLDFATSVSSSSALALVDGERCFLGVCDGLVG